MKLSKKGLEKTQSFQKKHDMSKWPVPACLFIGIGVGLLTGQVAAFTLIGLGAGFLITFLSSRKK